MKKMQRRDRNDDQLMEAGRGGVLLPLKGPALMAPCDPAELKQLKWLSLLGLLMVLCGDSLRKAAMLTAGSNFNHIVQNEKARSHVLVTSGVYAFFRHPSYVGWFYWSTGTQVRFRSARSFWLFPACGAGWSVVAPPPQPLMLP